MQKRVSTFVTLLVLLSLSLPCVSDDAKAFEPYEAWYVLKLGGQKAGHMHAALKLEDGKIVNETAMILAIKRGETELRIEQSSRFVETTDYEPLSVKSAMKLALMATEQEIDFTGDQWTVTAKNAGQQTQTKVDPPDVDWLTPGGMAAYLKEAIDKGDKEISVTTLDPSMGTTPVTIKMTRGETKDIEVFGRVTPATLWTTTLTNAPGIEIQQWTDDTGQPVKQMIPLMPGMEIEMLLADKDLALAEFDAPEMLAASFIKPDKPIKNPRKLKRAVFDVTLEDLKEKIGDGIPNAGFQKTEWVDNDTLRIEIDLSKPATPIGTDNDVAYLNATSMLNFKDKKVKEVMRSALKEQDFILLGEKGLRNATPLAESLRNKVRTHIEAKDLSVGFASASETARTKQGDCTEHACLLAAVLRGAGIPSRTVTGLVYADQFAGERGIFGFHMWTQAWIRPDGGDKGYWLDLDAAMPGQVDGFDATHIALSTSAMKDGESFNEMVTLLPLMQGMEIKIVETEWAE